MTGIVNGITLGKFTGPVPASTRSLADRQPLNLQTIDAVHHPRRARLQAQAMHVGTEARETLIEQPGKLQIFR